LLSLFSVSRIQLYCIAGAMYCEFSKRLQVMKKASLRWLFVVK